MMLSGSYRFTRMCCFYGAFFVGCIVLNRDCVHSADIVVGNLNDSGAGSLREAIGNAAAGDRIVFDIAGGGTITLSSDLPMVTDSLSFTNMNVAAVEIDQGVHTAIDATGGTIDL